MNETWMPVITALVTGLLSLLGVYIANRKSASLIEYKIGELKDQVEKHNKWGDRITTIEVKVSDLETDIADIKKKVG